MNKKILLLATTLFITIAPMHAAPRVVPPHAKKELRKAQWALLKSAGYLAGYVALKNYWPQGRSNIGFFDAPFSIFMPINASTAVSALSAWNAAKAVYHYYLYRDKLDSYSHYHHKR